MRLGCFSERSASRKRGLRGFVGSKSALRPVAEPRHIKTFFFLAQCVFPCCLSLFNAWKSVKEYRSAPLALSMTHGLSW